MKKIFKCLFFSVLLGIVFLGTDSVQAGGPPKSSGSASKKSLPTTPCYRYAEQSACTREPSCAWVVPNDGSGPYCDFLATACPLYRSPNCAKAFGRHKCESGKGVLCQPYTP